MKGCWKSQREETERVLVQTSQFFFFLLSLSASLSASRGHQLSKPGHWDLHWHGKLWIRSSDLWSTDNHLNNTVCVPVCVRVLFITGSVHYCSQASHHHSRDLWVWAGWYWEGKTKMISKCFVKYIYYFKWDAVFVVEIIIVLLFSRLLPTMSRQQTITKERNQTGVLHSTHQTCQWTCPLTWQLY